MGRNTIAILTTEPLQYLLITLKVVSLEKVPFSNIQIVRLFFNTFTADDKYYLLKRDILTQPMHMQLSQKQTFFSQFFFCILKMSIKL